MSCKKTTKTDTIICAILCNSPLSIKTPIIEKIDDYYFIENDINSVAEIKWFFTIDNYKIYESDWGLPSQPFSELNNGSTYSNLWVGSNAIFLKDFINSLPNTKLSKINNLVIYLLTKYNSTISTISNKIYFQI